MATASERNKLPLAAQNIASDTLFFWMGDTAWLLMQQCSKEEAFLYLKNRKEKGFNVIQVMLAHSLPGEKMSSLAKIKNDATAKLRRG